MPTLVEELKRAEEDRTKTKELEKAIKEFIIQPKVYDTLKKGAQNGITAEMNGGFTRLKAKNYDPRWERLGYIFFVEHPEQVKPMLTAHIDLLTDGVALYIEHYDSNQLTNKQVLQSLKTIIGLDEE